MIIYFSGTKSDLRVQNSEKYVTAIEGKSLKKKIGAMAFVECSAKKKERLADVFEEAVKSVGKPRKIRVCTIL